MTMDFETMMIEDVVRGLDAAREAGNAAEVERVESWLRALPPQRPIVGSAAITVKIPRPKGE